MDTARPATSRGRWTCCLYLLGSPLSVGLLALTVAGIVTVPVTAGLLILTVCVPATRALTGVYRREAARLLGEPVPPPYRSDPAGGWSSRIAHRARDPQTWRDLLWLPVSSTIGLVPPLLSVALLLLAPWALIQPLLMALTTDVFDQDYGPVEVDSVATSLVQWVLIPLGLALWWFGAPPLMRLRARLDRALLGPAGGARVQVLRERVTELAEQRSQAVDVQAAELRRIERDLHDGAQARLVASGMTLGMAVEALDTDPRSARALLEEAQATTDHALQDLRTVVRGIHPPVLSDRGLRGAVEALAVELPLTAHVDGELGGRPPAPIESAVYFAVAELLANVGRHARAHQVIITLDHDGVALHVSVEDDGRGGAGETEAGGLAGLRRRLGVVDGVLEVASPRGGPTRVAMMVPCELSSPRT